MQKRFTLIRPPAAESVRPSTTSILPPLGLAYITGALRRAGCEVSVIDAVALSPTKVTRYIRGFLLGLTIDEIVDRLPETAHYVGITCTFTHEWPIAAELIHRIKKKFPQSVIVIGGEHVTSLAEFSLSTSLADFAVLGEGEKTVVDFWTEHSQGRSVEDLPGLAIRTGAAIQINPRRAREKNLEAIAWPDWRDFGLKVYHQYGYSSGINTGGLSVPLLATRGCPYQCSFCSSPNMWTTQWSPRDPCDVVDEIESLQKNYGATDFPLQDLTAIIKRDWILQFCKEICRRELKISWQLPTGTRCEVIDDEVSQWLKKSGMVNITYAPESGSERVRTAVKKQLKSDRLMSSLAATCENGLGSTAFFVVGFPGDTRQDYWQTVSFVRELARNGLSEIAIGYYMALPGTELFEMLYQRGRLKMTKAYFTHILQGAEIIPRLSFHERFTRPELFFWKVVLFLAFFSEKLLHGKKVEQGPHKLTTALRTMARNGMLALRALAQPRWISQKDEAALFKDWETIYRRRKAECDRQIAPLVTDEKTPFNISAWIKKKHSLRLHFPS